MSAALEEPRAGAPFEGRIARELGALALGALAVFCLVSLASLDAGRRPNLGGPAGAALAGALNVAFGYEAYVLLILLAALAQRVWAAARWRTIAREAAGGAVLLAALSGAVCLFTRNDMVAGGAVGAAVAGFLQYYLNLGGSYIVVMLALLLGLALMLRRAPTDLVGAVTRAARFPRGRTSELRPHAPAVIELQEGWRTDDGDGWSGGAERAIEFRAAAPSGRRQRPSARPRSRGGYKLPPQTLLDTPLLEHTRIDQTALEHSAQVLEQKLADFGVEGRVVEVQPGPVVTMYKFEPGSGIKVSQIVNLADDLSMALRAAAVRIQAPVPGEAVVGVEVPNRRREKIYLGEIMEAQEFAAAGSLLTIALGKDIAGQPVAADLAKMPHLLIAGATGAGKSVSIHTMIASILFNATADDVRFILIDPKMLELSVYEGIPHLLVPVVVDPEKAAAALLWATQEMEWRYRLMRDLGVRNIDGYNKLLSEKGDNLPVRELQGVAPPGEKQNRPLKHQRLPKIVIVIDELADLLLSEGKTVERDITRLAQKARASGIHLILATQRPSVDVITGLIKANLPARISFQVTSRVDSRTILDSIGAERLLGAGDMLFLPPGSAKLRRLHGPFVSEAEIRRLADFLRAQGEPEYRMEILETKPPSESGADLGGDQDEMYDEAVRIVMETNQASISMIQRRLRIGYNRAARMVERMEREGIVMPADGARPREVRMRGAG